MFCCCDQVYVTDFIKNGGISVFSEEGHFIKRIMNCKNSCAICIAPDDHMITTINDRNSITVFSPTHECIAKFGVRGIGKGQFCEIMSVAINNSGIEFYNKHLQIISYVATS